MFYFVGNTLTSQITGIESAQLKRLRLFQQFNEPAKYVNIGKTMDRTLNAQKFGLNADSYINMIDFLCDIPFDYHRTLTEASLKFGKQHKITHQNATMTRYADGYHVFAEVYHDEKTAQLVKVFYYDTKNRSRVEDLYDP